MRHRGYVLGVIALAIVVVSTPLIGGALGAPGAGPASPARQHLTSQQFADTPTSTVEITNTNTNTTDNQLTNTNGNRNNNTATATANASAPSLSLPSDGNGPTGCTLPPPGTDSFEELQKLLADNDSAGAQFGTSVTIDRNTETIVVGARDDINENGNNAGAVYVFTCQGNQFVETQKLLASDGAAGDQFGYSVTIDGDSIVVGAAEDDTENGTDAGAAYVFERQNMQFVETQKLFASDGTTGANFGVSVAIDGDSIVVGAPLQDDNGQFAGAAYVFERQGGSFVQMQKLLASDGASDDDFGLSVAIDGGSIVTGAPLDDNENGENAGAAYVFE